MTEQEKEAKYTFLIAGKLAELFDDDDLSEELQEGDNTTHFIHALANSAPNIVFQQITGKRMTNLDFNHMANRLVFQYSQKTGKTKEL